MAETQSKSVKKLSVKAYAKLIGKSDKTVYKMIKEGLVKVKKGKSGYEVAVDSYILQEYKAVGKELSELSKVVKELQKRVKKLEASDMKTPTQKKESKPIKKAMKKRVEKSKSVAVKKPLKKSPKENVSKP